MKIETSEQGAGMWVATTDNYTGPGEPIGMGDTERHAIEALVERLQDDAYAEGRKDEAEERAPYAEAVSTLLDQFVQLAEAMVSDGALTIKNGMIERARAALAKNPYSTDCPHCGGSGIGGPELSACPVCLGSGTTREDALDGHHEPRATPDRGSK